MGPDDSGWIEEQYEQAGFIPSDLATDRVVIAEIEGTRAGLGRLVGAGEGAFELGGIYVRGPFRGLGIARAIVDALILRAGGAELYCVPFADLEVLYAAAGFARAEREEAPAKVQDKLDWCAREVTRAVLLMKLRR